jgi:hypothetical protein
MLQRPVGWLAGGMVVWCALAAGAAEPTPGPSPTLRVLVAADEMPEMFSFAGTGRPGFERELIILFKYVSEDALALIALARRE